MSSERVARARAAAAGHPVAAGAEVSLRRLVEHLADGVLVLDTSGALLYMNPAAERMFGMPAAALAGTQVGLPTAEGVPIEVALVTPDGQERAAEMRAVAFRWEGRPAVLASLRDVSDRRRAEQRLRDEAERHRAIVATAPDAIIIVDAGGLVREVNPAAERMLGRGLEEVSGRPLAGLLPPDRRRAVETALRRVVGLQGGWSAGEALRTAVRRRDGAEVPVKATMGAMSLGDERLAVVVLHDLTEIERQHAELVRREAENRELMAEQRALARVAVAAARQGDPDHVLRATAAEAAQLLGGAAAVVPAGRDPAVWAIRTRGGTPTAREQRVAAAAVECSRGRGGLGWAEEDDVAALAVPIRVGGAMWGGLAVVAGPGHELGERTELRMKRLADLAGIAVANARAHRALAERAVSDPLTGLPNRRAFDERLAQEIRRARRHGHPLSVVVCDVDRFKLINDTHGHQAGDRVLNDVAGRLAATARRSEMVARMGGEEFGWILPETDLDGATRAAERALVRVSRVPVRHIGHVTMSFGVAELGPGMGAADLFRLADRAMYRAKARGRNRVERDDAGGDADARVLADLAGDDHGAPAERLVAFQELARAIDARSRHTLGHSERVAVLAARLAASAGWPPDRCTRLHDAALLHDLGRVGVPEGVLEKPGPLTPEEAGLVREHAMVGARIAADVLDGEQASWVRHQHERWGGGGGPDRLEGTGIPEGARLIAVADAFDAMTSSRPYRPDPLQADEALRACRAAAGTRFCPSAVEALERVIRTGMRPDAERRS